jgi:hypothetical protein
MSDKLWSVKAYQLVKGDNILDQKGYETKVSRYVKKLVVIGNHLTWSDAQTLRKKYASAEASVFPEVKDEELKIIKLG